MKIQDINGNERNETRQETIARHKETMALHAEAMTLLESIHAEDPYFQQVAEENRIPLTDLEDEKTEKGLTTEINRSTSLVSVRDTVEGCAGILKRHPHGFKNGSRDSKGRPSNKPFTAAENAAAEKWLESLKNGTQTVAAEDEAD